MNDWTFSGIDALDTETSNGTAATPFPIGTFGAPVASTFDLQITEIWPGNEPGENLSEDWFEITNVGTTAWVSGVDPDLFYDDESQDATVADLIQGITQIEPGEAVVIVVGEAGDVAGFQTLWSPVIELTGVEVGYTDGAGLGQGGDGVTLFVGDPNSGGAIGDFETYPDADAFGGQSYNIDLGTFSVAGQDGAVATLELNDAAQPAIGSPGNGDAIEVTPELNLVFSEIMFNPASAEDNWEWVELFNAGANAVDLSGFVIDDGNGTAHPSANIASGLIGAGETAVLYNADDVSAADFAAAWGQGINLVAVTNWSAMGLNNGGDTLGLWQSFADYTGDNEIQNNALISVTYPGDIDDDAGSLYLTDLADQNSFALSTDGVNTPAGGAAYTSQAAGGNGGADVGSPGGFISDIQPPVASNPDLFERIGGASQLSGAEISAFDPNSDRLFVVDGSANLQIFDLSDPSSPALIDTLDVSGLGVQANSVAINNGVVAVAIEASIVTEPGTVAFYDAATGALLDSASVGALPDMVTFTSDGSKVLVANEGEPDGGVDPEGSISIVSFDGAAVTTVETADFTAFDADTVRAAGVRIFPGKTVAEDVEPEYITISDDNTTAYVALQENNAIAVVDIATATVTAIQPLGTQDHSVAGNELDASDRDGVAGKLETEPVSGLYMPDAIASFTVDGQTYTISANEGDARDEDVRIADIVLDPTAFPDAATLQQDENLGRLQVSSIDGDPDGDGDFDQLFSYGGRSFTIRDAAGNIVFDSGNQLEALGFANSEDPSGLDGRSDNKGPEPEGVTVGAIGDRIYAFIGLERANGTAVYDVTEPANATFVQYLATSGDVSPEGLTFISADESPNGANLLVVANEVSNSISIYATEVPDPGSGDAFGIQESFETAPGTTYTLSATFDDGDFDYFDRYEVPDSSNPARDDFQVGWDGSFGIQGQDHDGDGNAATQTISIDGINIAGGDNVAVTVALGALASEPDFQNYEAAAGDGIKIFATVDGGTRTLIGAFAPSDDAGDLLQDTDLDGVGDGAVLTPDLTDFSFALGQTGSVLDLDIELTSTDSFEPLAVDNVRVAEVIDFQESFETEPGTTYTLSATFDDGGFDYFDRYAVPDNGNAARDDFQVGWDGNFGIQGQDHDGDGNAATQTITISDIDIFGGQELFTTIALGALSSEPDFQNYEAASGDGIQIFAKIDDGDRTLIGAFAPSDDAGDLLLDTDLDGVGDGTVLNTDLQDFSFAIEGTGDSLTLEIELTSTDSFEPLAVDNVRVGSGGIPEGSNEPAEAVAIYEIQGESHTSPLNGQSVITSGIVTAVAGNGFYVQDATGDNNDATSDAIFVFTGSAPGVNVGDELEVEGTVSEFFPGGSGTGNLSITQISNATFTTLSTENALPAAVILGAAGRKPPTESIDDDAFTAFEPNDDGIDFFESLEGMLVIADDPVAVSGTDDNDEIFTVVDGGTGASGLSTRNTLNIGPNDFNPEKVQIDVNSSILPGFDTPEVNAGAKLSDVTGVVSYGFGNFEILPTEVFSVVEASTNVAEVTSLTSDDDQLTIASYNVLNLDPNDNDGNTDVANGQFEAIAAQIVNNLKTPDIIGLQEIQDNSGSADTGETSASMTLQMLADAIAAAGGPKYEFIDNTFIGDQTNGGDPAGNIRTAYLYNPDRVSVVPGSVQSIEANDQQTNPDNPFFGGRLPLVATFDFNGEEVTVVNNHFSSKGGSAPIFGVEQPFDQRQEDVSVNGSLDERQAQSEGVQTFVSSILANDPNANVVVLGDLNEFEFVSPVLELETNAGLNNLTNTLPEDERYSFIFQGNSQSLDHILVSDSLAANAEFDIVHVNVEFAEADQASDHEPLVARLNLSGTVEPEVFTLELLHAADQEAGALAVQDAPRFSAVLNALRAEDLGNDGIADNTLTLSSGDAFIPGLFYDASAAVFGSAGIADIQIQNELGFQAIALGNHEFDFGTAELAALIDGSAPGDFSALVGTSLEGLDFTGTDFPYLSTNLDFSTDANLAPLEVAGGQAPQANVVTSSTVIDVNDENIGVVGATTPTLGIISNPGDVTVNPQPFGANPSDAELDALAAEIQVEVDDLLAADPSLNKVVLLAHMQQLDIELALAERLVNVDIIVAGGSNTRLFDDNDRIRPGDSDQGQYPQFVTNAGGTSTAVVNTDGSYKYVGRLVIDFDADGNIIPESYDETISGAYATDAQGVADLNAESFVDPEVQAIANAIEAQIIATEGNVFGTAEVFLNGNRSGVDTPEDTDGVRTQETNLGNLTADANLAEAKAIDPAVVISLKNGGGIRAFHRSDYRSSRWN